ncbi:hypothetical protein [Arsukibacterium indicum]|uniref:Uncharacterized protein n=1 Tax=Arsukibacterium indicum TaxID=2848612 RepID=A0ABS6MLM1_9GAMM|nr:hypothetical protein [Arsukibacterium indicum]MBV2129710.1 hypothetical protein [Arsukibacterium indicum]
MHMIANLPRPVFAFLYLMWGGVKHKYMTFLTPKYAAKAKQDLAALKFDCEAIIWILSNKDADYSGAVARAYTNQHVINFAATKATIFLHEDMFQLAGVTFNERLIPEHIKKEEVLRFYVDYPPDMSLMRHLYRNYINSNEIHALKYELFHRFRVNVEKMLQAIMSVSHFDSVDYAIAVQDYDNPKRAEEFFRTLEKVLEESIVKH